MTNKTNLENVLRSFGKGLITPFVAPTVFDWEKECHDRFLAGQVDKKDRYTDLAALAAGAAVSSAGLVAFSKTTAMGKIIVPAILAKTNVISAMAYSLTSVSIKPELLDQMIEDTKGISTNSWNGKKVEMNENSRKRTIKIAYKLISRYDDELLGGYHACIKKDYDCAQKIFSDRCFENGLLYIADRATNNAHYTIKPNTPKKEIDNLMKRPLGIYRKLGDKKAIEFVASTYRKAGHEDFAEKLESEDLKKDKNFSYIEKNVSIYQEDRRIEIICDVVVAMMKEKY